MQPRFVQPRVHVHLNLNRFPSLAKQQHWLTTKHTRSPFFCLFHPKNVSLIPPKFQLFFHFIPFIFLRQILMTGCSWRSLLEKIILCHFHLLHITHNLLLTETMMYVKEHTDRCFLEEYTQHSKISRERGKTHLHSHPMIPSLILLLLTLEYNLLCWIENLFEKKSTHVHKSVKLAMIK